MASIPNTPVGSGFVMSPDFVMCLKESIHAARHAVAKGVADATRCDAGSQGWKKAYWECYTGHAGVNAGANIYANALLGSAQSEARTKAYFEYYKADEAARKKLSEGAVLAHQDVTLPQPQPQRSASQIRALIERINQARTAAARARVPANLSAEEDTWRFNIEYSSPQALRAAAVVYANLVIGNGNENIVLINHPDNTYLQERNRMIEYFLRLPNVEAERTRVMQDGLRYVYPEPSAPTMDLLPRTNKRNVVHNARVRAALAAIPSSVQGSERAQLFAQHYLGEIGVRAGAQAYAFYPMENGGGDNPQYSTLRQVLYNAYYYAPTEASRLDECQDRFYFPCVMPHSSDAGRDNTNAGGLLFSQAAPAGSRASRGVALDTEVAPLTTTRCGAP